MTMTMDKTLTPKGKLIAGASVLLLVAACGGGAGALSGINSLGAAFVNAFKRDANGTALPDPDTAGLTVNPSIDPFNP